MSEPIDRLREDWSELVPPPATGASDPAAEAVTRWLAAAWEQVQAPEPPEVPSERVPRSPGLRAQGPIRRLPAALLSAAAGLTLVWFLAQRMRTGHDQIPLELGHANPAQRGPSSTALSAWSSPMVAIPRADGSIEMRSGKARLILFSQPTTENQ